GRIVERVAEHYARGRPVGSIGSVLDELSKSSLPVAEPALAGLARGWPADAAVQLTVHQEQTLAEWLPRLPATSRGHLVSLATRWGSKALDKFAAELAAGFLSQVRNESQ